MLLNVTICQTAPHWPNAEAQFPLYLEFKVPWAGPAGAEAGVAVPGMGSVAQDVAVSAWIQFNRSCSV